MTKNKITIAITLASVSSLFLAIVVTAFSVMELRASNTLLRKLKVLQPGIHLSSVTNQLGYMIYEIKDVEYMTTLGSIKDASFCKDKKLFWFAASTPPCRALEIYTDTNDVVVFVTWQKL